MRKLNLELSFPVTAYRVGNIGFISNLALMPWEVSIISANEYILEEILGPVIPEKYFITDNEQFLVNGSFFTEKGIY